MQNIGLINPRTIWSTKNLIPFLSVSDILLHDASIGFFFGDKGTKHAQFWFGLQGPFNILILTKISLGGHVMFVINVEINEP